MSHLPASQALARYKVLDLTRARAGPTCARHLADWGADVIKIEMTEEGGDMAHDRHGPDFQNLHRNKRSMTLNLKDPEGLEVFKRLVRNVDVVVENYRPDVKFRLGIDYETLKAINPRLILGSISGFGQEGPYRERPGFDQIAQGMGGLMWITGLPGQGPVRVGVPIADLTAGMFLAMGVMAALLEREQSGEGQWVRTSLLQAQIAMLDFQAARWLIKHEVPPQAGNDHPTGIPTGVFPTSDGHINIAASNQHMFRRLCAALDAPHIERNPDFANEKLRSRNRAACNAAIGEITRTRTSAEWIALLNQQSVPCGPIYKMNEVFADPQVKHLGMAAPVHSPALGDIEVV
ncbi:MAG: CoA transferase, partial [Variibacter sp.]|nr:CoA transferase [Variibacter sp.]